MNDDALIDDLLNYIEACPTPWHAVSESVARLHAAGYRVLDEKERWSLSAGDRVFVIRGGTSLAAFQLGTKPPSEAGFRIVGAHTDSPNFRVKPHEITAGNGVEQIAVEPYGGVLLHTWLDRDLSIAGRVMVRDGDEVVPRLVRLEGAVCRIASLAIHLNRKVNDEGLVLNKQTHMAPHLSLDGAGAHTVRTLVARRIGVPVDAIEAHDLCLFDVVPPTRGGAHGEFIFAPRLDNLASCHAGLAGLVRIGDEAGEVTRGVVLYDHEEVGSRSKQGADSPFLAQILSRLVAAIEPEADALPRALAQTVVVSADMAHAVHPNWSDRHEPGHMPQLGRGPVIKSNANQRYATDGETAALFRGWCRAADVKPQDFVTRSDLGCGSTIGPITAGQLGARAVDVGNPMLSMHSCREMAGAADVGPLIRVFERFFAGV